MRTIVKIKVYGFTSRLSRLEPRAALGTEFLFFREIRNSKTDITKRKTLTKRSPKTFF